MRRIHTARTAVTRLRSARYESARSPRDPERVHAQRHVTGVSGDTPTVRRTSPSNPTDLLGYSARDGLKTDVVVERHRQKRLVAIPVGRRRPSEMLLLLIVSFLPFPTRLIAEYMGQDEPGRIAATFYGVVLLLGSLLVSVLWRHAVHTDLLRPDTPQKAVQSMTKWLTPGLAGYAAMIAVGLFLPSVAVVGYLAIALYLLIPFETFRRRRAERGAGPARPRRISCLRRSPTTIDVSDRGAGGEGHGRAGRLPGTHRPATVA